MAQSHSAYGLDPETQRSESSTRRKSVRRRRSIMPFIDTLEVRITPSTTTSVWTGAGNGNFSDPADWQGNTIPSPGNTLDFPLGNLNSPANFYFPNNDLAPDITYNLIQIDDASYDLTGNEVSLTNGITTTYTAGNTTFEIPLLLTSSTTTIQVNGGLLNLPDTAPISQASAGLGVTKTGAGILAVGGAQSYTGATIVNGGNLFVQGTQAGSQINVNTGATLSGSGTAGVVISTGGTVGATFNGISQIFNMSSLTLDSNSTFTATIKGKTPGSGNGRYDQVILSGGALQLNNATLNASLSNVYTPVLGDKLTLIQGASSVSGTFNGLSQGAYLRLSGNAFQISYTGGTGDDVVLSFVQNTVTTVTSGVPNPSTYNSPVTLRASVTTPGGTPTGTVSFYNGATFLGTGTLSRGNTSIITSALPVGSDAITAVFSGDGNTAPSTSASYTQVVNQAPTTTSVSGNPNPSTYGQLTTLTANVTSTAGTPTGTVTFTFGSTVLGTGTLAAGTTSINTSALPAGADSVTATYNADTNFAVSSGNATQTVQAASSVTTLTGTSPNPSIFQQTVHFTATVAPQYEGSAVTGTVTFEDGGTVLGTGTLSNGTASIDYAGLSVGTHSAITAVYNGDSNVNGSTSTSGSQTVNQATTTTVLSTNTPNPSVFGQSVTLSAVVSPQFGGTPSGTVQFYSNGSALGAPVTVSSGTATLVTSALPTGSDTITAQYLGDSSFTGSTTTSSVSHTVNQASTASAVVSGQNPSVFGQSVTFTATISAVAPGSGTPSGSVSFFDGSTLLGTGNLDGSGQTTFATSSLSTASHQITVSYAGDTNFTGSASSAITQVVNKDATTSTITLATPNPTVFGQSVTYTVQVVSNTPGAGIPTGQVVIRDNGNQIGLGTLDGSGQATFSTPALTVGGHPITASYSGDGNFLASLSPIVVQGVNKANSVSVVATSGSPSVVGQSVTFTATVTALPPGGSVPPGPSGIVTFLDGSTTLGTATLDSSGVATLATSALALGSHSITIAYSGDNGYNAGTSLATTQVVNQAATSTALQTSGTPSVSGQSVTFTATVSASSPGSGTPTGTVTFIDGKLILGTGTLSGGVATFATFTLSTASHSITAVYGGDTNYTGSTSSIQTQVVNQANTSVSVLSSVNPTVFGQSTTFTVNVSAASPGSGTPTGSVTISDGSTVLTTVALTNGSATFIDAALSVGKHAISASYSGDGNFNSATSPNLSQSVDQAASSAGIVSSVPSTVFGQSTTFTANVSEVLPGQGVPTGTITFFDGSTALGTGTLSNGIATFSTSSLGVGSHAISASYGGDGNFTSSSSSTITQAVGLSATGASVTSPGSTVFGQSVTLTATIAATAPGAGTPTGVVLFEDGSTPLGTAMLNGSGQATFTTSSFSVGTHQISVIYGGDSQFTGSTSEAYSQIVAQASTSTALVSATNPTVYGQPTTFTATVAATSPGVGFPTGTVTFYHDTTAIGTVALSGGAASLSPVPLPGSDTHSISAVYNGDTNFKTSTSNIVSQSVNAANTSLSLTSSANASVYGQTITYNVTASAIDPGAGTPSQSVTLSIDSTVVATITLTNGSGSFTTTTTLVVGSHNVVATLASDANFNGSTNSLTQTVNKSVTTTTTVTTNSSTVYGQNVSITAYIHPVSPGSGIPTGTAAFMDGTTLLGTVPVTAVTTGASPYSSATFSTSSLAVGNHTINVVYSGDGSFTGSTGTDTQTVAKAATSIPVVNNVRISPSTFGQTTAFSFTVSPTSPGAGTPTGNVTISDGGTVLTTLPYAPVNGSMVYQTPTLNAGTHVITVTYGGDGNFTGSSGSTSQTVVFASTYGVLTASPQTPTPGQPVTFTVNEYSFLPGFGTPTGTVNFLNNGILLGSATVVNGQASLTIPAPATGTALNVVTNYFPNTGNFGINTSNTIQVGIAKAESTILFYFQNFNGGVGFPTTVIATSPATGVPTGVLSFYVNNKLYSNQTLVNGMAGVYIPKPFVIGKTVYVVYNGDANFNTAKSNPVTITNGILLGGSNPIQVFRAKQAAIAKAHAALVVKHHKS